MPVHCICTYVNCICTYVDSKGNNETMIMYLCCSWLIVFILLCDIYI